ncbi:hypothetical protein Tsubulata_213111 [Turnera subulata]|uniref:Receptor-like serine/threonine-protein kinase n=1 Tax=Turnera subulata TaxID=218843 RepID=A0A9Q0FB16_9ROSI|nr:hypothetical protein Tsubulata_213111 [Turnera subulata]
MGKQEGEYPLCRVVCFILISLFSPNSAADGRISLGMSINDSQTIVSPNQRFELGFFTPGNSSLRYLGIWYKNIPAHTVVWVANRDNPLTNSSGLLTFGDKGNIVILNQAGGSILWSTNSSGAATSPVAELLDTGNFVLRDGDQDGSTEKYLWQSFDNIFDTLLPGMKLGWNKRTGLNQHMTSWKSINDPSSGDYTYTVDPLGLPQLVLRRGSTKLFRSGPWYGPGFSGVPAVMTNPVFEPKFVINSDEVYYSYDTMDGITSRFVLSPSGFVQHWSWNDRRSSWNLVFTDPGDRCDNYGLCGSFGLCDNNNSTICSCMRGFEPRSPQDWGVLDWWGGCVRKNKDVCGNGEGFIKLRGVKLPDASEFLVNVSMTIDDCKAECLRNCSCVAYAKLEVGGKGNGCVTWSRELIDTRAVADFGQDIYVRVAASDLAISRAESRRDDDLELPLYDFATIRTATNNFSTANKLGEGGFGPVYKGELQSGQEVAVKRLGENSGQGLREFKNEVIFISRLQHRNLVKLLGCCIQGDERMLIYEYMPNRSLDALIFDEESRHLLNWQKRLDIIIGIARGLLYLHRDSRLRIIHRDLKASNVLLDSDLNPKISDFGMARMFGGDQTEGNTKRIVGTYGYMPPEYAIDGNFSLKSDVFSFGVILLEIVSGKKNRGFFHAEHNLNLLGHAWKLWNEERSLELVDPSLENQFPESEVLRCIHVGLLCVQQKPEERPTMPTVVLMLDSESTMLPEPGRPGFYAERCLSETESSSLGKLMSNEMTVTLLEGR